MCFNRFLVNLIVEKTEGPDDEAFCFAMAKALKEYADACLAGKQANNSIEEFRSSNGCDVRMISGLHNYVLCILRDSGPVTRCPGGKFKECPSPK